MNEQISVTVRDSILYETLDDEQILTLFFPKRSITVQELIRERVYSEVKVYNENIPQKFHGLIEPTNTEKRLRLNLFSQPQKRNIDPEKQYELAILAFQQNGFILMVDEKQMCSLDEKIELRSNTSVVFLKLVPLVGG